MTASDLAPSAQHKGRARVLLVGYNGKNNTGSEARLLSIVDDVTAVFGPEVQITVPTLNPTNLRRYLKESSRIRIVRIPTIYHLALRHLARGSDFVLLTEGSCYMDTWGSPLLRAFLWTTKSAVSVGVPVIAYAVDAGRLKDANRRRVQCDASQTDLIITRTKAAADRLATVGVTAPIKVTEDTAFTFRPDPADAELLKQEWPEASNVVGMAVVNFLLWPVVVRPWAPRSRCYQWPYYFSDSKERRQGAEDLARNWAKVADRLAEKHGRPVALFAMEGVDEPLARKVHGLMKNREQARIFTSSRYNASQMASVLRSLDLLITSRYHACVLSLEAHVPQVAVGHDVRLEEIYHDLGISDCFFWKGTPGLRVADLSLLPRSQGLPAMLIASALALRVARGRSRHR
jgi:polysaccharide pyruvyl transferase WcaK-like protein